VIPDPRGGLSATSTCQIYREEREYKRLDYYEISRSNRRRDQSNVKKPAHAILLWMKRLHSYVGNQGGRRLVWLTLGGVTVAAFIVTACGISNKARSSITDAPSPIITVGSTGQSEPPGGPSTSTAGSSSSSTVPFGVLNVGDDSNGQTITVHLGQEIVVTLNTTDWMFEHNSAPSVIRQAPEVVTNGPITCRSQASCGSVSVHLMAQSQGEAVVRATREKCGELRRCTDGEGLFSLSINVSLSS
jgi:hypothetical protein